MPPKPKRRVKPVRARWELNEPDTASQLAWGAIESYIASSPKFLTKHQLESYDDFINHKIPQTISSMNAALTWVKEDPRPDGTTSLTTITARVGGEDGGNIYIDKPTHTLNKEDRIMLPNEARIRGMTYASNLFADVLVEVKRDGETESFTLNNVMLGAVPIMLHSGMCVLKGRADLALRDMGECPFDQGGYFIVDGKEKVIISQIRNANNVLFVKHDEDDDVFSHRAFIRCTTDAGSVFPKTTYWFVRKSNHAIRLSVRMLDNVPVFHMFRLLGVESDRDILRMILGMEPEDAPRAWIDFLHGSIVDGSDVGSQIAAIAKYSKMVKPATPYKVLATLLDDLFINVASDLSTKARYLAFLVNRMVGTCLGVFAPENRDDHKNKRIDLAGVLMANIFRDFYNEMRNQCRTYVDSQYNIRAKYDKTSRVNVRRIFDDTHKVFDAGIITNGLRASLKGKWGLQKLAFQKIDGIVQDLNRVSYAGYVSHVRRANTPLNDSAKIAEPHKLYGSQWGYLCPVESPDGPNIGLLVHLAVMCHVTSDMPIAPVIDAIGERLKPLGQLSYHDLAGPTKVFINGTLRGVLRPDVQPKDVYDDLKRKKMNGALGDRYVSITWRITENAISVLTEGGRTTRPLIRANADLDGIKGKDFDAMCTGDDCVIEFLDPAESHDMLIAPSPDGRSAPAQATHRELHPTTILSPYTCTIPFSNHNAAARNIFSGAQGRQAVSVFATNFASRMDVASYVLHYGQRPLVSTRMADLVGLTSLPNGENPIVAIACYSGYNQEDSIIINRASIERGAFSVTAFKSHAFKEQADESEDAMTRMVFAPPTERTRFARYDALDAGGFPIENQEITEDHALLGTRVVRVPKSGGGDTEMQEVNEFADKTFYGMVDRVYVDERKDRNAGPGTRFCRVRLRQIRTPQFGDKLASRHGQKGVVGAILSPEEMPFSCDGIVPDIIINPHAFPSRMTVAHLIETVFAKWAVNRGCIADGTPFEDHNIESVGIALEKMCGFQRHGSTLLYNARNGEQIPTEVFFGPTFYFRQKHMTCDKINFRSTGPLESLTHQPVHGRANDGGLRIGEMERDAVLAHGMGAFLKEAFMERADGHVMDIGNGQRIACPYAFKLLTQEMAAMSIGTNIEVAPRRLEKPWMPQDLETDEVLEDDLLYDESGQRFGETETSRMAEAYE